MCKDTHAHTYTHCYEIEFGRRATGPCWWSEEVTSAVHIQLDWSQLFGPLWASDFHSACLQTFGSVTTSLSSARYVFIFSVSGLICLEFACELFSTCLRLFLSILKWMNNISHRIGPAPTWKQTIYRWATNSIIILLLPNPARREEEDDGSKRWSLPETQAECFKPVHWHCLPPPLTAQMSGWWVQGSL